MNKISILHISDLHKEVNDDYQHLLSSIETDIDKCSMEEQIKKPDIIVVSGDIIKGAEGANAESEITNQYNDAKSFLESLVNLFLAGDKRKMIIVPGNHDVNREFSKNSMKKIEHTEREIKELYLQHRDNFSSVRWNWSNLSFYKIIDIDTYKKRFKNFTDFYNSFYEGLHSFSENPEEQSCIYHLGEYKVAFVGFNSCYNIDHLNISGCIHPTCLTRLDAELKQLYNQGNLIIGVWHHHTAGFPNENNYLDKRILSAMIDRHIYLGLHGHQHICGIANEFKSYLNGESLFLVSAGTIYGGEKELPYGAKRQYNILEIDFDDEISTTVYSREDQEVNLYSIPSWNKGHIGYGQSLITFKLPKIPKASIESLIDSIIKDAENEENLIYACDRLIALGTDNILVRKFLLDYLLRLRDNNKIYDVFINPQNIEEAIATLNAVIEINDRKKTNQMLCNPYISACTDPSVKFLKNEAQRLINK
jgi:hypothetical protein